ncbi:hypothetical protein [Celeribacter sp. SCSIO 80788]|uniref:hypothetical protein n=1 Tax=Celeribacter sp. SCSIO 80788 TaxID=3117013 RepID=UPI003DA4BA1D
MTRNKDNEGPIQRAVLQAMRKQYPRALIFSVPNELASKAGGGAKGATAQARIRNVQASAKGLGMLPGMADLCMVLDGRFYAFEVKAGSNTQQENQKAVQAMCEAAGGHYAVVRSAEGAIEFVKAVRQSHGETLAMQAVEMRGDVS